MCNKRDRQISNNVFSILVWALFLLLMAACTSAQTPVVTNTPLKPTETSLPSDTPIPTSTIIPTKTPTSIPTNTPTVTASPTVEISLPEPQPTPPDIVVFNSDNWAFITSASISFQHPRNWQTGYFSEQSFIGYAVSDVDPNKAFYYDYRTGDIYIHLLGFFDEEDQVGLTPIEIMKNQSSWGYTPDAEITELDVDDRKIAYQIANGNVVGAVVKGKLIGLILGEYPVDKEDQYLEGLLTVINSFDLVETDINLEELSFDRISGERLEGTLEIEALYDGYVPLASRSQWDFAGTAAPGDLNLNQRLGKRTLT